MNCVLRSFSWAFLHFRLMDTLVNFGSEIKQVGETEDSWQIEGLLVNFGTHDASHLKDKFTEETDFDFEDGERTTLYYNHGLDGTIKREKIGGGQLFKKDAGVWFKGELKKRTDYLKEHVEHIAEGMKKKVEVKGHLYPAFGLSSGAPAHLVEREAVDGGHVVTKWPLRTDCSITPTPAEPNTFVGSIKSLDEIATEQEAVEGGAVKAGRAVSGSNHSELTSILEEMRGPVARFEAFLATHVVDEADSVGDAYGLIREEQKSIENAPTDEKTGGENNMISIRQLMGDYVRNMAPLEHVRA